MTKNESISVRDTDALLKAMLVLSRTVDHVLEMRASEAADEPLSKSKLQILRLLHRREAQTSTDIARFLNVSKPGVSQIVSSMLRRKLLHRHPSDDDRRQHELSLTDRGRNVLGRVQSKQRHFLRSAIRDLGEKDIERWAATMNQIARALVTADQGFQEFCLQCGAHANDTCVLTGGHARCLYLEARDGRESAAS